MLIYVGNRCERDESHREEGHFIKTVAESSPKQLTSIAKDAVADEEYRNDHIS